jgi:hypothetical protein
MRNRLTPLIVRGTLGLLLTAVVPGGVYAQDSSTNDTKTNLPPSTNPADQSYSVSLADGQAIPLSQGAGDQTRAQAPAGQAARTQLLYGGTASVVYMDNYAPASIESVTSGVFSPYVGLYVPTKTGGMTLQYLGTFTPDGAFTGDFEAFHSLAFNAAGAFTHRLYWSFSSNAEYGSEDARFEGPLTYQLVGLVPVVDPVASGSLFQGRNTAFVQTMAKLGWRRSQRDRIELSVFHVYSDISSSPLAGGSPGDRSNAIGTKLDYARDVTSRVTFHVYGDEEHVMESSCNTYGAGAGVTARLSYSWYLDVSGGPQWTSANCGSQQNYNFYGALVKNLRAGAKVYAVAWRSFNTAFQSTSTWQDAYAVGILYPIRRFSVQGDAGYFRGDPLLVTDQPIQGYYVAPLVRYRLTEHTSVSAGYRIFHATGGNTVPGNLHYAMVSLEWHPGAIRLK